MNAELKELKRLQLNALRQQLEAAKALVAFHQKQYQDAKRELEESP